MADLSDRDTENPWCAWPGGGLGFRPLGVSAAIGLVLFFVCAIYTHIQAADYSPQFGLAIGFLGLNVAALALSLPG